MLDFESYIKGLSSDESIPHRPHISPYSHTHKGEKKSVTFRLHPVAVESSPCDVTQLQSSSSMNSSIQSPSPSIYWNNHLHVDEQGKSTINKKKKNVKRRVSHDGVMNRSVSPLPPVLTPASDHNKDSSIEMFKRDIPAGDVWAVEVRKNRNSRKGSRIVSRRHPMHHTWLPPLQA